MSAEDTATLLGDFVSAIDNVPSEVAHLMEEVGHKDKMVQEIQLNAIHLDETLRANLSRQRRLTDAELEAVMQQKDKYADAMKLCKEKIVHAERARALVSRHLSRLGMQLEFLPDHGELPELPQMPQSAAEADALLKSVATWALAPEDAAAIQSLVSLQEGIGAEASEPSRRKSTDRLRAPALSVESSTRSSSPRVEEDRRHAHDDHDTKRRKAAPAITPPEVPSPVSRTGPSRTVIVENGAQEDPTPYCFCHRPSYGEMIGCDANDCKYEWFHLSCVGLKATPEGKWYCPDCQARRKKKKH